MLKTKWSPVLLILSILLLAACESRKRKPNTSRKTTLKNDEKSPAGRTKAFEVKGRNYYYSKPKVIDRHPMYLDSTKSK